MGQQDQGAAPHTKIAKTKIGRGSDRAQAVTSKGTANMKASKIVNRPPDRY